MSDVIWPLCAGLRQWWKDKLTIVGWCENVMCNAAVHNQWHLDNVVLSLSDALAWSTLGLLIILSVSQHWNRWCMQALVYIFFVSQHHMPEEKSLEPKFVGHVWRRKIDLCRIQMMVEDTSNIELVMCAVKRRYVKPTSDVPWLFCGGQRGCSQDMSNFALPLSAGQTWCGKTTSNVHK